MKKILAFSCALVVTALIPLGAFGAGAKLVLDRAPIDLHDKLSLQRGAQIFVNHCLNCHSASLMRYSRLTDLGLSEADIRANLLFATDKIGEPMSSALDLKDAKAWFGAPPPDLSLTARARGADWLYTYFRGFYRDDLAKSGWNNTVFPNVSMPHVLWEYQGDQALQVTSRRDPVTGDVRETRKLVLERPGSLSPAQYDRYVADLTNFLSWVGEPAQASRKLWGALVLFFLGAFFVITLLLKHEYWKDVR